MVSLGGCRPRSRRWTWNSEKTVLTIGREGREAVAWLVLSRLPRGGDGDFCACRPARPADANVEVLVASLLKLREPLACVRGHVAQRLRRVVAAFPYLVGKHAPDVVHGQSSVAGVDGADGPTGDASNARIAVVTESAQAGNRGEGAGSEKVHDLCSEVARSRIVAGHPALRVTDDLGPESGQVHRNFLTVPVSSILTACDPFVDGESLALKGGGGLRLEFAADCATRGAACVVVGAAGDQNGQDQEQGWDAHLVILCGRPLCSIRGWDDSSSSLPYRVAVGAWMTMSTPHTFDIGDPRRRAYRTRLRDGAFTFVGSRAVSEAIVHLVGAFPKHPPRRVLLVRDPGAVATLAAAALWPEAEVTAHHFDAFEHKSATANLDENPTPLRPGLLLAPDLPVGPFDLVAMAAPSGMESLLVRELIEQAHDTLRVDGRLLVATDRSPKRLRKVVKEVFGRADLQGATRAGGVVAARRRCEDPRRRDHDHVALAVRGASTLRIRTRPGVFSPGRIDPGARALLSSFDATPGSRVLDLGCGVGVLGLCAGVDAGPEGVVMVDSNARAVAVATDNAVANDLGLATVVLRADLEDLPGGPFDLALANPPYFSQGRIAAAFARAAARALSPGGRLLMVAKAVPAHREILESFFGSVSCSDVSGYGVFEARR